MFSICSRRFRGVARTLAILDNPFASMLHSNNFYPAEIQAKEAVFLIKKSEAQSIQ